MRHVHHLRHARSVLLGLSVLAASLAGCPTDPDDDDDTTAADPWVVEQIDLPGAALSIWALDSSDVWVAGTGAPAEPGEPLAPPMLLHRSDGVWEQLDTGEQAEAWWVVGVGDELIWVVGSEGLVLRYDRAAETFTRVPTNTNAKLFGAWVAPSGTLYAVGGVVSSSTEGSVLLRVVGDVAEEIQLPAGVSNNENLFKVWGADEDDIWVISDMGTVLHFDGAAWTRQVLPDNPRLVTVHGSGADDVVVVGGQSRPSIFQRSGGVWEDLSPAGGQPLNGVFVRGDDAFAAGASVMERTNGIWTLGDGPLALSAEWHGVWLDETNAPWVVGGDLTRLQDGVIARREDP